MYYSNEELRSELRKTIPCLCRDFDEEVVEMDSDALQTFLAMVGRPVERRAGS